jgi:hypothetical protein
MRARRVVSAGAVLTLAVAAFPSGLRSADPPLLGFSPESSAATLHMFPCATVEMVPVREILRMVLRPPNKAGAQPS